MAIYRLSPGMAVAFAAIATTPAAAQTAPAPRPAAQAATAPTAQPAAPSNAVEQIVVTANKRRERQRDVANSVTAITGAQLDRRQEISVQDLVSQVPGLSIEADDKSEVRLVLRGLNTGGAGTEVASVLDDVPTNPTGAQNQAAINTPNYDTYDLQRIEVLRGPQSTLYGATAEGGLIKYVTNPPDPTRYSAALEGGIDGTTDGGIGGSLKGFANFPLLDGKAAVRITAWNEWIPGFIDDPARNKTDYNSGQQYGWRASLLVTPTPDLTIRLTAERQTLFSNGLDDLQVQGAALTPGTPPANQLALLNNSLVSNARLPQPAQNEAAVYYANLNYDLGFANVTSITSFAIDNFNNRFDLSDSNLAPATSFGAYLGASVYGMPTLVNERQNSDTNKFNQEVRLTSDPGTTVLGRQFEYLAGAYYSRETASLLQGVDAINAANVNQLLAPAPGSTRVQSSLSDWAVFGQVDYYLLPTLDVALGGRFEGTAQRSQTVDFPYIFYAPAYTVQPETTSNDHDALYSVAPRWRVTDDTMFYGRIATGYRPGGPNLPVPGHPEVPNFYNPDRTVNYEIGWRQDLFNKSVSIDLTGFYINWRDVQVLSVLGPFGFNSNAGSALSKGVEWTFTWVPFAGLRLNATGSYQDSLITSDDAAIGAAKNQYLPYVPNVSNSVNVDYTWKVTDRFKAYVSGTWSYVGERFTGFAPAGGAATSHILLPSYNTGSLRGGVEDDHYGLEFYVNNISDNHALTYYAGNGGANQTGLAAIIQPRTIGMLARVKF